MKVRSSVKKICSKCKIVRRNVVVRIICENIEDIANNVTRFLVISREDAKPTGEDKTAILFSTAHKAGALAEVLEIFKRFDINMTNIESRPSRKMKPASFPMTAD